jgi:hypothetical protein
MTDRDPVNEPSINVQRMAERALYGSSGSQEPVQPITLTPISGRGEDHIAGSIVDQWGACLTLSQAGPDGLDVVVLDFVQAETLYTILDQFFNT